MMKPWIERTYHPYWDWEEVGHNMWGSVKSKDEFLAWAIAFTGDHERYGAYMLKVAKEWKKSCEHNLSNTTQNRKAWIGHAACALAYGCPESIVRGAWSQLTKEQQIKANEAAQYAIEWWESQQCQNLV